MKAEGGRWKAEGGRVEIRHLLGRRRGAMTLFEVLLVLVLLVVVGSLAAPLFEGSLSSIRLRRGTDHVLASWSQARTHAIESGTIFQFRFQPEGSKYRVDRWSSGLENALPENNDAPMSTGPSSTGSTPPEGGAEAVDLADWKYEASLPEKIIFSSAKSVFQDEFGQRTITRLDQDTTTKWSAPILFFPDGTTSAASLLLKSGRGGYRRATLRGLTGVARASELLTREEIAPISSR